MSVSLCLSVCLLIALQTQESKAEAIQVPVSATVEHHHMFSVGEGMLTTESRFIYDVR